MLTRRSFFNISALLTAFVETNLVAKSKGLKTGVWKEDDDIIISGKTVNVQGILFVDGDVVVSGRVLVSNDENPSVGRAVVET